MTTWPGYYDVVLLPSPAVRDYAIELSRRLRRFGGRWTLGKRAFLPHISLYHIAVAPENFDAFADEVLHLAASASWGPLETKGFDMGLLMFNKPSWLVELHWKLVRRTVRYFDWSSGAERKWDLRWFKGSRQALAKRYLQRYGSPAIGNNFRPHITLSSSFKDMENREAIELDFRKLRFRPDRLHICELGPSHSCQRVVH